ncbi:GH25 family lysozyme [Fructobacillus tropaeoli]|uniref:Lysozyme n=1 Tax=Fructobacillus tropaeoli TaxID=709323 RepID=A0ABM9MQY5_9LACO|nr:Glucan-binding domain (YG repeat) [Fructobacillus tropaeoli]
MNVKNTFLTLAAATAFGAVVDVSHHLVAQADSIAAVTAGQTGLPRMDVVDVSSYQGYLTAQDYVTMRNNGVKGIIVKLTEGTTYKNPYAQAQVNNARAAGLTVSAYHYSDFNTPDGGRAEANYFADFATQLGFKSTDLLVDDLEDSSTVGGNVSDNARAFNDQLHARGFTNTTLYTYASYKKTNNLDTSIFGGDSKVWIAQYPYNPSGSDLWNTGFGMWQWSSNASFNGISGKFDVSMDYTGMATNAASTGNQTNNFVQKYIDGKWYLIDPATGNKQYGRQYLADQNKWVLYDRNTGAMLYGQQYDQGNWYYFDPQTGAMQYGRQYLAGQNKWVLYDRNDGTMKYGQQYDQGHWYLFDSQTGAMQYGWQQLPQGKVYYDTNDGTIQYGPKWINGKQYIFNAYTGSLGNGEVYFSGNWYLADSITGILKTGYQQLGTRRVFYDQNGVMVHGEKYIDGKWYYFDTGDGSMKYGRQYIAAASKWVLYNRSTGEMLYGPQYDQGNWYLFDSMTGAMKYGWQLTSQGWAYYDLNTGIKQS